MTASEVIPNGSLEEYFEPFRRQIVGYDQTFESPYGTQRIVYTDWTASGRLYGPIEERLSHEIGTFVGNTHSESSVTGTYMTLAYHEARQIIKNHVNASKKDVLLMTGSGMTGAISKLQRMMGFHVPEQIYPLLSITKDQRPIVFVTHMEHHSNHTSWFETIGDVECIQPDEEGLVDLKSLENLLKKYADRPIKIASITACSNVTGIRTPIHTIARMMHEHGGLCFVDFACSAPYVDIDMHPADPLEKLDAIYFSPHKFLGGPGSAGVLIFDAALYHNKVPDQPGGGTVDWTNPWGGYKYNDDIEVREDGGTPAFLQTIKAALSVRLKEQIGVPQMLAREAAMLNKIFARLEKVDNLHVLAGHIRERLGVVSFYFKDLHFNLVVKLLNDRFGIQMRGGCSCAGTYGHFLLNIDKTVSRGITDKIDQGDLTSKPGWVRLSIHPTMTDLEIDWILDSLESVGKHGKDWARDYEYDRSRNEYHHRLESAGPKHLIKGWFGDFA